MDLETLPTRPGPPPEVLRSHEAAERDLLAAAVAFTKTQDAMAASPGQRCAASAAESAHGQLKALAKAYGRAHAELVAAS